MATSNVFKLVDNGRIFQYSIIEGGDHLARFNKSEIFQTIEDSFPRAFLSKMIDYESRVFFSISFKSKFSITIMRGDEEVKITFKNEGEKTSNSNSRIYFKLMIENIFERGKLVNLDDWHFNPFETNDDSSEVSMVPVFSYGITNEIGENSLIIKNQILFSPVASLYEVVNRMMQNGMGETQIRETLTGSIVKLNY